MRAFVKKHDILTKLVSVFVAITLWAYVIDSKNPIKSVKFDEVLVELTSEKLMEDNHNLVIVSDEFPKIALTVEGPNDAILKTTQESIKVEASLASISEPGTYELDYNVKLGYNVNVKRRSPEKITVIVDEVIVKEIPIVVKTKGNPETGYLFSDIKTDEIVNITGPKNEVDEIVQAEVTIDLSNMSTDINGDYEINMIDFEDNIVKSDSIKTDKSSVNIQARILKLKEVPVEVTLNYGLLIPAKAISGYEIDIPKVTIFGIPNIVDSVHSINLGTINTDDVITGKFVFTFNAPTIDNINYYEGADLKFNVTLKISDYVSKEFLVTNFVEISQDEPIGPEEGEEVAQEISIISTEILVKIYGKEQDLKDLSAEDITIKPIFDKTRLVFGENEVDCEIIIDSDKNFDILNKYKIILEVK